MKKLKLVTLLGTRPEIIRLSEVIKECDKSFDHVLVHTGQNWDYTLNEIFFKDLNLRQPNYYLNVVGQHLGETIGNVISKSYECLVKEQPDAVLILGDTNSCLSAIAAKRLKIPIFHMEAGNRCFDMNVPEEINRRIVDHTSDINLAYTEHARRYLVSEGINKQYIIVTGSPMYEVLQRNLNKIQNSQVLTNFDVKPKEYFVLSTHREENVDNEKSLRTLTNTLMDICSTYKKPILFSCHPRTKNALKKFNIELPSLVKIFEPLGFTDYVKLQMDSFCVLSDSGTLSEESAILDFPAVLIRTSTERPEVMDTGHVIFGSLESNELLTAIGIQTNKGTKLPPPVEYQQDKVSLKVVNAIASYTSVINRNVWHKS